MASASSASSVGAGAAQWDPTHIADTLRGTTMMSKMKRPVVEPPHSPLLEYVQTQRRTTPTVSDPAVADDASEASLDSVLTATSANSVAEDAGSHSVGEEEAEAGEVIARLCRSLYRRALQKTAGARGKAARSSCVPVDPRHERNMSRVLDWMPLLHLFDPKTFFAYRDGAAKGTAEGGVCSVRVPTGLQMAESPREASRHLVDELQVEKLSGGNSNHVYRLCHPQFPGKSVLLRVYGGGGSEAIDRYRDVTAMKQMGNAQLSPLVLHTFKWGRVEEFMENAVTGTTDMMIECASLLSKVYGVLHTMHQLPVQPFLPETVHKARLKNHELLASMVREVYDGPQDYLTRNVQRLAAALASGAPEETDRSGYYSAQTEAKLLEVVCPTSFERSTLRFLRLLSPSLEPAFRTDFVRFIVGEILQVRELLQRTATPIVFSHNDLNPANILFSRRVVPEKHRPKTVASTHERSASEEAEAEEVEEAEGDDDDDDDEGGVAAASEVTRRGGFVSRRFITKKGRQRSLVELKGVVFIDFEYSDANYRAIDIGNTLCELDYDYSRGTEDGGPGFIKYLRAFPPAGLEEEWSDKPEDYPRLPELLYRTWQREQPRAEEGSRPVATERAEETGGGVRDIGESCLRAVSAYFHSAGDGAAERPRKGGSTTSLLTRQQLTEVFLGILATQLHWSLWSFTLACNPDTLTNQTTEDDAFAVGSSGLDYIRYGDCRLKEYLSLKTWLAEHHFI